MSALLVDVSDQDNKKIYEFHQPVVIPSYLVAIAVGALVSKQIGPRSKVWAEKEFINQSAYEFGETETMLQIAEQLCGPYVWGKFEIVISNILSFKYHFNYHSNINSNIISNIIIFINL